MTQHTTWLPAMALSDVGSVLSGEKCLACGESVEGVGKQRGARKCFDGALHPPYVPAEWRVKGFGNPDVPPPDPGG